MQVLHRGFPFVDNICQTKAVGVPHSRGSVLFCRLPRTAVAPEVGCSFEASQFWVGTRCVS